MDSSSILDAIFPRAIALSLAVSLPGFLIRLVMLLLSAIGWYRHRQLCFVVFTGSWTIGLISSALSAVGYIRLMEGSSLATPLITASTIVGYLGAIVGFCGLAHLVFRANFVPPHKPEVYQP